MKHLLLFIVIISSFTLSAKSFRTLSSVEPFEISSIIETEGFQNIHLLAKNKSKVESKIPLVLYYIINQDTLKDYLNFNESIIGSVKTLFLMPGDSLKVQLMILNPSPIELKIKGNLSLQEPMVLASNTILNEKTFNGDYWDMQHPCIFKLNKQDTIEQFLNFHFDFTENYLYDNFYVQVNMIGPDSSFVSKELVLAVNTDTILDFKSKYMEITSDFSITTEGKYIIELVPLMTRRRINGIKSAGFKRVIK